MVMINLLGYTLLFFGSFFSAFAEPESSPITTPKCKDSASQEHMIRGFANTHYLGKLREASRPTKNGTHILELYKQEMALELVMGKHDATIIPDLRIRTYPDELIDIQFGGQGKNPILIFDDRVELFIPNKKTGHLAYAARIPVRNPSYVFNMGTNLIVVNENSISIAGKKQALLKLPFTNLEMATTLREARKINGIAFSVDSSINLVISYIAKEAANMTEQSLAFYSGESDQFVSKRASDILDIITDSMELSLSKTNDFQDHRPLVESVSLRMPLLYTGSAKHSSRHHTFMSESDFKIEVLRSGYAKIFQNIFEGHY